MGSILDMARRDTASFIRSGGFETELTFTKDGEDDAVINGIAIKRTDSLMFDDGSNKTEKFSRIIVNLTDLPDSFKSDDLIVISGWSVSFADSEGYTATYKLFDSFPNKTFGTLSVNLSNATKNVING